jgi:hypothetical protein
VPGTFGAAGVLPGAAGVWLGVQPKKFEIASTTVTPIGHQAVVGSEVVIVGLAIDEADALRYRQVELRHALQALAM